MRRGLGPALVVLLAAVLLAGCSSSKKKSSEGSGSLTINRASSTTAAGGTLEVLITNDDGVSAPGIEAIASALTNAGGMHVVVVAPAANQSGAGGKTTPGTLTITNATTMNGSPAHAVAGFPADTIRAALDQLHLHPDLVISGINAGQNLGPAADISGTVGAARAAVARGIPAVAVSSGTGDNSAPNGFDFAAAVPFVTAWITAHRADLLAHRVTPAVTSFNVPSCSTGSVRGLQEVAPDTNKDDLAKSIAAQNCTSTITSFTNDVDAFLNGFATSSTLPASAAS